MNQVIWNHKEVAAAIGASSGAAWEATGVAIDSRALKSGQLFVALKGARVDGHDYIKEAFAKGAAAVLAQRVPECLKNDPRIMVVEDTYKALNDLAVRARARTKAKIIGITGSVGKTGTKEALALALGSVGEIYATHGNLNNHIGVPLSLANLPADAQFGIFELGMNHAGEISYLSRLVRPDVAVITTVEAVHLEFFPSIEAISDAKAEIFEGMNAGGVAVLNYDNRYYERLEQAAERAGCVVTSFGTNGNADCQMRACRNTEFGSEVEAIVNGTPVTYRLGAIGRHWGLTSVAVLAIAEALHCDLASCAGALAQFREPEGRGRLHRMAWGSGAITVIDDSYNASPASMVTAFTKLSDLYEGMGKTGRRIAVLGDMLELGLSGPDLHAGLLPSIEENEVDLVFAAGPLMKRLYECLPEHQRGAYAENSSELAALILEVLSPGDIVLIKGSHGSRMDIVVKAIITQDQKKMLKTANKQHEELNAL